MYARDDGCGLAAPQCGVNLRVMVYNYLRTIESIDPAGHSAQRPQLLGGECTFVNPKITASSEEQDEACKGLQARK